MTNTHRLSEPNHFKWLDRWDSKLVSHPLHLCKHVSLQGRLLSDMVLWSLIVLTWKREQGLIVSILYIHIQLWRLANLLWAIYIISLFPSLLCLPFPSPLLGRGAYKQLELHCGHVILLALSGQTSFLRVPMQPNEKSPKLEVPLKTVQIEPKARE